MLNDAWNRGKTLCEEFRRLNCAKAAVVDIVSAVRDEGCLILVAALDNRSSHSQSACGMLNVELR